MTTRQNQKTMPGQMETQTSSILALDAGFRNTGYAVFERDQPTVFGTITTSVDKKSKTKSISRQNIESLQHIGGQLARLIDLYAVELVVFEAPHGGSQSANAARAMAYATAVVVTVSCVLNVPCIQITPTQVKKLIRPKGEVTKDEVMDYIRGYYSDVEFPKYKKYFEHIADACGAYLVARRSEKL